MAISINALILQPKLGFSTIKREQVMIQNSKPILKTGMIALSTYSCQLKFIMLKNVNLHSNCSDFEMLKF